MKIFPFYFLFFVSTITSAVQASELKAKYPPILDFYPNCSYKIIKNYSAKDKFDDPYKREKTRKKILLNLRTKANDIGADAVILVAKKITRKITPAKIAVFTIHYEAELIKQCNKDKPLSSRLTAYNHLGDKVIQTSTTKNVQSITFSHTFTLSNTINHPEIKNKEVSLENGIYGIKLGESYQQVTNVLGTPNTILNILTGELIVGYGRRHWFHFQHKKLVKIQTFSAFLSQNIINKIPLLDFFDDFEWKVNDEISYNTRFSDIKKALHTRGLDNKRQLIIKNNTSKLTLFFNKYKDHNKQSTYDKQSTYYKLNGFSLEKNTYNQVHNRLLVNRIKQFKVLNKVVASLNKKEPVDFNILKSELGHVLGTIILSKQEQINIYNNNLLAKVKNNEVKSFSLVENIFLASKFADAKNTPWYLGKYKQGQSIDILRKNFPNNSFELDNEVEIESDEYLLSLFFEQVDNDTSLNEANVILY